MPRLLFPIILAIFGTGAGAGLGLFLGVPSDDTAEETAADSGGPSPSSDISPSDFVRLNNQFVVPVVREDRIRSLIVMSLTLEVPAGKTAATYDLEPRLRDTLLRVMFDHANMGGFDGAFTQADALDLLRDALRLAANDVLDHDVLGILITDIARQDM